MEALTFPLSSRPKWRDLQFRGPLLEMFFSNPLKKPPGTSLVSSSLHPVTAGLHVAPSPGMVLARIEKKPSAGRIAAILNELRVTRDQQISRALGQDP